MIVGRGWVYCSCTCLPYGWVVFVEPQARLDGMMVVLRRFRLTVYPQPSCDDADGCCGCNHSQSSRRRSRHHFYSTICHDVDRNYDRHDEVEHVNDGVHDPLVRADDGSLVASDFQFPESFVNQDRLIRFSENGSLLFDSLVVLLNFSFRALSNVSFVVFVRDL